ATDGSPSHGLDRALHPVADGAPVAGGSASAFPAMAARGHLEQHVPVRPVVLRHGSRFAATKRPAAACLLGGDRRDGGGLRLVRAILAEARPGSGGGGVGRFHIADRARNECNPSRLHTFSAMTMGVSYSYVNHDKAQYFDCGLFGTNNAY